MCAPSSLSQASTRSKPWHCSPATNLSFVFLSLFSPRPIFGEEQGGRAVKVGEMQGTAPVLNIPGPSPVTSSAEEEEDLEHDMEEEQEEEKEASRKRKRA